MNNNLSSGLLDHINVALVVLSAGLLVGCFFQQRYYLREGIVRSESACVKAIGIDWKYGRSNAQNGHIRFQLNGGESFRANEAWITLKAARSAEEKNAAEKVWLESGCFQIWFEKNKEVDARIEDIKPPLMTWGGVGQWLLCVLVLLFAIRKYLKDRL